MIKSSNSIVANAMAARTTNASVNKSKIWNEPRSVEVSYASGWKAGRRSFRSLAECEAYLKKQIGNDTYIDIPPEEVDGAADAPIYTKLAGNEVRCGTIIL